MTLLFKICVPKCYDFGEHIWTYIWTYSSFSLCFNLIFSNTITASDIVDTSDLSPKELTDQQLDSLIQNIPAIEINNEDGQSVQDIESIRTPSTTSSAGGENSRKFTFNAQPGSNTPSLQQSANTPVPVTALDFSVHEYIDDQELEKKFNNLVFTFKTDIYTLQKRLESQVCLIWF